MKQRFLSICTALALCLGLLPGAALAAETVATDVKYIGADGTEQTCKEATVVTEDTIQWSPGWYVVEGNVDIGDRIIVTGDVHLILGGRLTAEEGINVSANVSTRNSLTIYGQGGASGLV